MHYGGVSSVCSEATLQMFQGSSTSTSTSTSASTSTSTSTSTSAAGWERPSTLLPPQPVSASCGGFRLCKKCPNHVGPLVTWPARSLIIVSATIMIAGCTLSTLSAWTRWLNDGQSIFWSNHNLLQRGNLGPLQRGNSGNFAILQLCHRFQIASNIWAALIKEICRALNIQLPYWEPERLQRSEGNPFIPLHRSLTRNRPTEGFGKQSDVWVQKGTSKALKLVL